MSPREIARVSIEITWDDGTVMTFSADRPERAEVDLGTNLPPWLPPDVSPFRIEPPPARRASVSFEAHPQRPMTTVIRQAVPPRDDEGSAPAEPYDYERSRARALEIHARTCSDPGWCNYGEPEPPGLDDDESLPWPGWQQLAGARLAWYRHCMAAVEAENRAGDRD